jgi:hypothetical protein
MCDYCNDRGGVRLVGEDNINLTLRNCGTIGQGLKSRIDKVLKGARDIHGHRTLKAPHPVRSAKLTRVPPS